LNIEYHWSSGINNWAPYSKKEILYDNYRNPTQQITYSLYLENDWNSRDTLIYKNFYSTINQTKLPNITHPNISIFPNPINNEFQVDGLDGKSKIMLIDLTGKIVLKKEVLANELVNVGKLPKGVYVLKINTVDGEIDRKLVIQ